MSGGGQKRLGQLFEQVPEGAEFPGQLLDFLLEPLVLGRQFQDFVLRLQIAHLGFVAALAHGDVVPLAADLVLLAVFVHALLGLVLAAAAAAAGACRVNGAATSSSDRRGFRGIGWVRGAGRARGRRGGEVPAAPARHGLVAQIGADGAAVRRGHSTQAGPCSSSAAAAAAAFFLAGPFARIQVLEDRLHFGLHHLRREAAQQRPGFMVLSDARVVAVSA